MRKSSGLRNFNDPPVDRPPEGCAICLDERQYVHPDGQRWTMLDDLRRDFHNVIQLAELHVHRCGGHFDGKAVLHWRDGADGRGVLFTGDTIDIAADTRCMSFMYSYPNLIPLSPSKVRGIVNAVEPFAFDRMYEAFGTVTRHDAKAGLRCSAERYIRAITD